MKLRSLVALLATTTILTACSDSTSSKMSQADSVQSQSNSTTIENLFDAGNPDDLKIVQYQAASGELRKAPESGLHIVFDAEQNSYSSIIFSADEPWDWSKYDDFNIAFDIANTGEHSVQLYLDISDIDGANYTRTVSVPVASGNTYYAKMAGHDIAKSEGDTNTELNFVSGLRSNPDTWVSDEEQFTSLWGKKDLNVKGITKIELSVQSALFDKQITIKNIKLRKNPPMNTEYLTQIVDKFGQNSTIDYAGKIHSEQELIEQRDKEAKQLDGKLADSRSKWGGWAKGPQLEGTGYFRTAKHNGKWSLVDPDGYLYFATGLDIIRLANTSTMTGYDFPSDALNKRSGDDATPEDSKGLVRVSDEFIEARFVASDLRKDLFQWLPDYNDPLGQHYSYRGSAHSGPLSKGETFSFYSANLDRKYSDINADFMDQWRKVTIDRMINWGFTSLGNWTDPSFYSNEQIPYFANGWIVGDYKTVSSGNDFWAPLPDVFDPKFAERAQVTANKIASEVANSPWCVGVFVDNEKSFGRSETNEATYGIVIHTLARDGSEVPTKAEFTRLMKAKYATIDSLNQAWDKDISSWEAFDKGIDSSLTNDVLLADYSDLLFAYADKYFSVVDSALNKVLPNHLYLGARFPDWGMPIEVVKASAQYVDVVSYNVYKEGLHPKSWAFLSEIDMPSIIGEFHMGTKDSGLFHPGLILASDQEDRGKMFQDYMHSVIDNPYFIGAHWFQYMDSPITGRAYDGENYNVGFVSVTDTPYQPMVDASKNLHKDIYERRFNQ